MYAELRQLAAGQLWRGSQQTLHPTELVHEAFVRMARAGSAEVADRARFYALAGKVMRSVLVDHARRRNAQKRDAGARLELTTAMLGAGDRSLDVLAIHEAMDELAALDPELVEIGELLLFAGLTAQEAGEALGVSSRTVERGWRTARAFLQSRLGDH